jgi:hypothetical protein
LDDTEWLLEIEDEKLGDFVKDAIGQKPPTMKAERFGVGINTPLRVFKVKTDDVLEVEEQLAKAAIRRK